MKISEKVTWKPLGDKIVAVKVESGEYYTMNDVASLIWKSVAEGKEAADIRDKICEAYEVEDKEAVLNDINTQLREWEEEDLLTV